MGPRFHPAQPVTVVKRGAVQYLQRIRQIDLFHEIAGHLVGVGAALRPEDTALHRAGGKAVGAHFAHRSALDLRR